jgi:hypothetical protein
MGIFGDILSPLKDIIHGLAHPVAEVERIFGTVISLTEGIITELVSLVGQLENLFDQNKFSEIFIDPFKNAIITSLNGIDTLSQLIFKYGSEQFDDIRQVLEDPSSNVYKRIHEGLAFLKQGYIDIVNNITPIPTRVIDASTRDLHSFIARIDNDIELIKREVKSIFRVTSSKSAEITQEFIQFARTGGANVSHDVNRVGSIVVDDARDLKASIDRRLANEHSALTLLVVIIVGFLIIGLIFIYTMTKSRRVLILGGIIAIILIITVVIG